MDSCFIELQMFSKILRFNRHKMDITQEKLAELVGCHVNAIGRLERAETYPTFTMIINIARALKISPKELMPY